MNDQIQVIGKTSSIIDYNLNEQYSNVKKIIVSSDEIISSFEDIGSSDVFDKLSNSTVESYASNLRSAVDSGILDSTIKSDLYKDITSLLPQISDTMMDIQIQGYNFMNSVSNSKFNITLRCESFSITKYYEERGGFLSAIRSLVLDYLEFFGNTQRLKRLKEFQIEIYESEDIHKHIFLKKDGSKLILGSNFGFSKSSPIDFISGSEFYFSTGEGFNFFRNSQTSAILREHNKLTESPIQTRDKILSDEELIKINNTTKHIGDAVIEMFLTKKGKLKILNIQVLENQITTGSDNGFFINKSSKNYNRISLVTLRDDLSEDMPNPKYLLLKNKNEIKNFLSDSKALSHIDGVVITENFYLPILDYFGEKNDLDIIYHKNELNKSLDIELNSKEVLIGTNLQQANLNPFNKILDNKTKLRDEHLEKLRHVDLSTPKHITQQSQMEQQQANHIAQGIIASPNSSINSNTTNYGNHSSISRSEPGKKLSAIDMLMHAAEQKPTIPNQQQLEQTAASMTVASAASYAETQTAPITTASTSMPRGELGKKLSAIDMLMHAAEHKPTAPPETVQTPTQNQYISEPQVQQQYNSQFQTQQEYSEPITQQSENIDNIYSQPENNTTFTQEQTGMVDHFAMYEEPKAEPTHYYPQEPIDKYENYNEQSQTEFPTDEQNAHNEMVNREIVENVADEMIVENFQNQNPQTFESEIEDELEEDLHEIESELEQQETYQQENSNQLDSEQNYESIPNQETFQTPNTQNIDIQRYNDIISTKLITLPKIESSAYFVDSSNISDITTQAELFYLTPTDQDLDNEGLNYIIPMGVSKTYSDKHNYIINSTNDYFLLEDSKKLNLFINLSYIDNSIKETFLIKCLKHTNIAYIVCQKEDIYILEKHINKLSGIFVKDLESGDDLYSTETKILTFEKNYLMRKF